MVPSGKKKKWGESAVSMANFHNDCCPVFLCFSFLSVNFVLNNSIAQHQELCLSKNTWGGSWHIYLSQLRIPFMKHLKRNWKKKNNIDFILQSSKASYISILVKCTWNSYVLSIHTYSWNSYLSNYFSTLIFFAIFKLAFTSHTTKNSRVTLSTLWGI